MRLIKTAVAAGLVTGALAAGVLGAGVAAAEPVPPPGYPAGDPPPPNAPAKPPQPRWSPNTPVVWEQLGYRWGVWINGSFLPLY
ncbi:hypothetical protein [Mycolicibacterium grossiae]|uniref:Uncharacterized protein n=1 Tax=Mycolicibacterium grossiae TaxID=1552759 RepID=A0A1E8Q2Y6_9MYCO|nr:hypothetical protein [Mycolicibacterium grossiae]OFJ52923.1 hypothetical protein BEL07_15045 [Mycolicibacterium grossiae]QEM44684.1 hypothetical protein FZ046_07670 [Mycolicibacterium grossiae]